MTEILKKAEAKQKFRAGRKNKLSVENRLLMTLESWKEYSTYRIIAKRYGITHTSCMRNILWIEDILIKSRAFNLSGKKELAKNKGTNKVLLVIDATETPVERIKKNKIIIFWEKETSYLKNTNNYWYF